AWLEADGWLGDVRELEAVLERAVVLCEGPSITLEHLPLKRWRQTGLQPSTPRVETVDFGPGGFGAGPGSRPEPYGQL
ncbi:MAG TPA: hypothetical protein VFS00_33700, partial [Polyangiaceae bacterium]|nr:hypothetical protein [Polyangiaceae bacterium]